MLMVSRDVGYSTRGFAAPVLWRPSVWTDHEPSGMTAVTARHDRSDSLGPDVGLTDHPSLVSRRRDGLARLAEAEGPKMGSPAPRGGGGLTRGFHSGLRLGVATVTQERATGSLRAFTDDVAQAEVAEPVDPIPAHEGVVREVLWAPALDGGAEHESEVLAACPIAPPD